MDVFEYKKITSGLMYLSLHSNLHREYRIKYLMDRIGWSLNNGTYRYYEINDKPIGFCSWVKTSKNVINEVMSTGREFYDEELGIDSEVFITEFIAPFGHAKHIVKDLKDHCFTRKRNIYAIRGKLIGDPIKNNEIKKFIFKRS